MSCRSESPVIHSFPPAFPLDTAHLSDALALFNQRIGVKLRFDQLSNDEMRWVIAKAQELKTLKTSGTGSPLAASQGETTLLPSSGPVPEKGAPENLTSRARKFVRSLVPWKSGRTV